MVAPSNPGAPLPSEMGKRWYKVITPQRSAPLHVLFLSDTFTGYWTHWIGDERTSKGVTLPCSYNEQCPHCDPRNGAKGSRWTGYACVYAEDPKGEFVLAIAEGMARQLLPFLKRRGTLRGCVFKMQRGVTKPNDPVRVTLMEERDPKRVPPAFDLHDSLSRMWGMNLDAIRRAADARKAIAVDHFIHDAAEDIPA